MPTVAPGKTEVRIPLSTLQDATPAAPSCATKLSLEAAQSRYQTEAVQGICDTGHYRMPYFAWGEGPPLVFIPGLADDRLSFLLSISRLAENFCCIAYDLPTGDGDGAILGQIHHADLVADLIALLDSLQISRCFLHGSSFGSTIALAAAHQRGDRFERLMLQGGFARRPLALGENLLTAFARYWPWHMRDLPLREETLRLSHYAPFADQPPERWQYFLERCGAPPMAAVARRARILHQIDLRPLLPALRLPVLMICGEHDPLVGKDCEADLLHGLPHVTRGEIERCGHLPQFSHPEILAEIVERYLGVKDQCALEQPPP